MRVSATELFIILKTNIQQAIQGKDCLVQKFRNSSVMLEEPAFRPKVRSVAINPDISNNDIRFSEQAVIPMQARKRIFHCQTMRQR
jgi:hypothetical protein